MAHLANISLSKKKIWQISRTRMYCKCDPQPQTWTRGFVSSLRSKQVLYLRSMGKHGRTKDSFLFFLFLAKHSQITSIGCRTTQSVDSFARSAAPHNLADHPGGVVVHPARGQLRRLDSRSTCHLPPSLRPVHVHVHALPIKPALHFSSSPILLLQISSNTSNPIHQRRADPVSFTDDQTRPRSMASSSVLLGGGAGAAALTGATAAGRALPRPCFLAARPHAVTGGRLCLQTTPKSSPVRICGFTLVLTTLVFVLREIFADMHASTVRLITTPRMPPATPSRA
jgi:hypothetical protein